MNMGYTEAGQKMNAYILAGFTIVLCVILHLIYKTIFGNKKCEVQNHEAESVTGRIKIFLLILVLIIYSNIYFLSHISN